MIRPEVQQEIDATKGALANLRAAVLKITPSYSPRPSLGLALENAAREILVLDTEYTLGTGVVLSEKPSPQVRSVPAYGGPMFDWPITRMRVGVRVLGAVHKVKNGRQASIKPATYVMAKHYYSAIWPHDLAWPDDIERPVLFPEVE